jgi:hypothetical protein
MPLSLSLEIVENNARLLESVHKGSVTMVDDDRWEPILSGSSAVI